MKIKKMYRVIIITLLITSVIVIHPGMIDAQVNSVPSGAQSASVLKFNNRLSKTITSLEARDKSLNQRIVKQQAKGINVDNLNLLLSSLESKINELKYLQVTSSLSLNKDTKKRFESVKSSAWKDISQINSQLVANWKISKNKK